MKEKPHKPLNPKANVDLNLKIKKYLRVNAPQVKFFMVDNLFTGAITTTERVPFKTKPGYKQETHEFDNFESLTSHYGNRPKQPKTASRLKKFVERTRKKSVARRRVAKKRVARKQPKARKRR